GGAAARREAGDPPPGPPGDRGQRRVDPRQDVVDEGVLPPAGPFAVVVRRLAGGRDHTDERPDDPGGDRSIRELPELRAVRVLRRGSRHAVEQVDNRVALRAVEAWREGDVAGAHGAGKRPLEQPAAARLERRLRESG